MKYHLAADGPELRRAYVLAAELNVRFDAPHRPVTDAATQIKQVQT